jgi:hypothetical protein
VDLAPIAGLVGMLTVVWKLIDFLKLLANWSHERSGVLTQVLVWLGAIAVVFLYGASDLGTFPIPGTELMLEDAGVWTKVILGLAIGSASSVLVDAKQAIDSSDTATKPPLLSR